MPKPLAHTTDPIHVVLPRLLEERGWSLRQLARKADVDVGHLSRSMKGDSGKFVSGELAVRIARALELPDGYFPEGREQIVVDAVRADPSLRDKVFRGLRRQT